MAKQKKIIISGGGSGGHVFPAIAIANALRKIDETIDILFVGANDKIEMEKVPAAGYEIIGLNISGFQRKLSMRNISFPFKVFGSMFKSYSIISKFKPDVAVGVGGFASGPLLKVAGWRRIPTLIQEQNSYPGVTNRLLAFDAKRICTAYDGLEKYFPKDRITITGNPVREVIVKMNCSVEESIGHFGLDRNKKTMLIVGGSLGARTLNESVKKDIRKIADSGYQVIWQTGKIYYQNSKLVADGIENVHAMQFIDRMDMAYTAADVIIARAGALTISELCLVGKPAILVPSPNVAEDHQTHNAMALVKHDAAIMIKDSEAADQLFDAAFDLLKNEKRQQELSLNIKKLAIPDAADRIAAQVLELVK